MLLRGGKLSKKSTLEHYVQQRYLKYFASNLKQLSVFVFDKAKNEIRCNQPINHIACEGGFYDINIDKIIIGQEGFNQEIRLFFKQIGKDFTDKYLSSYIEPLFNFIDNLVNQFTNKELCLNSHVQSIQEEYNRNQISFYITFQYLRTVAFRDYFQDLLNQNNKNRDFLFDEKNSEYLKIIHTKFLFNNNLVSAIQKSIAGGVWILGQVGKGSVLYTSDNPVYVLADFQKEPGIFTNVLLVSYPLTPNLLLLIMSPETADRLEYKELENRLVELNPGAIDYFNHQRVTGAYRSVFCSNKQMDKAMHFHSTDLNLSREDKISQFFHFSS